MVFKHCNDNNIKREFALISVSKKGKQSCIAFCVRSSRIRRQKVIPIVIANENQYKKGKTS